MSFFFFFFFSFQVDDKEKATPELSITRSPGSDVNNKYYLPANSLVQSVLEARAMRDNELELRPVSRMFKRYSLKCGFYRFVNAATSCLASFSLMQNDNTILFKANRAPVMSRKIEQNWCLKLVDYIDIRFISFYISAGNTL